MLLFKFEIFGMLLKLYLPTHMSSKTSSFHILSLEHMVLQIKKCCGLRAIILTKIIMICEIVLWTILISVNGVVGS